MTIKHLDFSGYTTKTIGLAVCIQNTIDKATDEEIAVLWKRAIVDANQMLPVKITMPCGNSITLVSVCGNGRRVDVPCPCGNPDHILVKYYE